MRKKTRRNVIGSIFAAAFVLSAAMLCSTESQAQDAPKVLNSCGIPNRSLSVDPTGKDEGFSAVIYDNSNGLPTSEANAIAETSEGFIWIGSYAGLIRYDGNTFERMDSTGGLTSIKSLYVDSKDRLWIGTNDNGVAVMERGNIKMWGKLDGMKSAHTRAIAEDLNGNIYVATTSGIAVIDPDYNLSAIEDERIADADMRYLRVGFDGTIYGSTDTGNLMMIRDGKVINYLSTEDSPLGGAGAIFPDPEQSGIIYQEAPDYCLYKVDLNDGFKVLKKINLDPLNYLLSMEYIDGKIWICAGNGIGILENDRFSLMKNLPMNNNVGHVMTDYLGNLWFSSTRLGVMKVVPNQFSDLSQRYDLPEMVVNSTCMHDGMLFVATDTGLTVIGPKGPIDKLPLEKAETVSGKELESKDLIELLTENRIRSIIRDSKNRLWISTWRSVGLLCYDKGSVVAYTEEDGLKTNSIRSVCEKKDGSILVALTGGANVIKDDKIVASYGADDGIDNIESLTVTEGSDGDIVLGSNGGGIYIIGKDGIRNINVEDGLPSDIVMRLKRDPNRDLIWIVTSNAIAYMTPDYKVTSVKKFPYPNNFDLYENSKGDVWVLSSNGIYVTPAEELLANGDIDPVFYGTASGLSCIATANSYSDLTPDGNLYIAGTTGICKVNIEESFENVNELKAVVPYVEADGNVIYPDEEGVFTIPSDTHKLTVLGFVYNYSFNNPQVSYQLEGFDSASTTIDRSDMVPVDYTNLRGGAYEFVMQLKDSMGRGNKEVAIRIVKEKAFYETTWFLIASALVLVALITLFVRFYVRRRMRALEKKNQETREQFEQTAEALANAIDAKDKYTNGHSRRVAEYSVMIAKEAGKSEDECEKVYFAALLHDVGKIGVPIDILSKKGRLTDEEFEKIKEHPVMGGQILSSIKNSPWLSVGARYHHEKYNGKGYPEGLKGKEISEIARIIAVADSYDAMTSNRSYRNAIPQHIVREELVKGMGTQFDPAFAKIMIHMIDKDTEYKMQETKVGNKSSLTTGTRCESLYHDCTEGVIITRHATKIQFISQPDDKVAYEDSLPALILYDSLDGQVHPGEENNRNILYYEYARIRMDGKVTEGNIRKVQVSSHTLETPSGSLYPDDPEHQQSYFVEAVHCYDHAMITIYGDKTATEIILAMPDSTRFAYISIGGERCYVHNIRVEKEEKEAGEDAIPRIAEKISFIEGCPVGDVPNIQIDGWCGDATEGIRIDEDTTLRFHSMSLPTARLVWHCPYISLYNSPGGDRSGDKFKEYLLLRLDGEDWSSDEHVENEVESKQLSDFENWDKWKEKNKQGVDCLVKIKRKENSVIITTDILGLSISSNTTIHDNVKDLYVSVTGDQCAITNIRATKK